MSTQLENWLIARIAEIQASIDKIEADNRGQDIYYQPPGLVGLYIQMGETRAILKHIQGI